MGWRHHHELRSVITGHNYRLVTGGVLGLMLLVLAVSGLLHASTPTASTEAESGTVAGATAVADSSASGGQAIKFDSGSTQPANYDQIGVIGDSLTYMNGHGSDWLTSALASDGWDSSNIQVDGLIGRGIDIPGEVPTPAPYTEDVISSWRASGFDPRVWLISLGTNNYNENNEDGGTFWSTQIQKVIDKIKSGPAGDYKIYWIGTGYKQSDSEMNTAAYESTLDSFASSDFVVCNYNASLASYRSDPDWLSWWDSSDIHNTNTGYQTLRVPFYVSCVHAEAPE